MAITARPLFSGLRRLAGALPLLAAVALGALVLVPALLGFQRYVILTGSMTGTYDRGSIVFDRVVPTSSLRTGDVITFRPPGQSGLVTHRIHGLKIIRGKRVFSTKGDFNTIPDVWNPFTLTEPKQAKVAFSVPYAGFALSALSDRRNRMLVIGIPAAFIALVTLIALFREPPPAAETRGAS